MSIFSSFLKAVGVKLGGGAPSAVELKKSLDSHNLGTDGLEVALDGDKVVLKGEVKDQETLEKAALAVGNIEGIASVDTDGVTVKKAEAESVFYTVKSGDTLSKIAAAQYGKENMMQYDLIFQANRPMLTHPDKIYPGQVLRIPALK